MMNRLLTCSLSLVLLLAGGASAESPHEQGPPPGDRYGHSHTGHDHPGDRGREDRGWGDRRDRSLSAEQIGLAIEALRVIDADAAGRVAELAKRRPDEAVRELRRWLPRIEPLLALRRYDRAMYDLRLQDLRLAHESRAAARRLAEARRDDSEGQRELEEKLRGLVSLHFDIRQKIRERELARLEERIERLREQLDERADDRDDLIEQRLDELTRGGAETQW